MTLICVDVQDSTSAIAARNKVDLNVELIITCDLFTFSCC